MPKFCGKRNSEFLLKNANEFKQNCLIEGKSLLTDAVIWTSQYCEELTQYFVDNPDAGEGDFFTKLETQLTDASANAKLLAAEMLWLMFLCPSNTGAASKRGSIARVFAWSGYKIDEATKERYLSDNALTGVGSAGTAYNTMRWRELVYLIRFTELFLKLDKPEKEELLNNHIKFAQWLEKVPANEKRQLRHMLLFLFFPDFNERIFGNTDRCSILVTLAGLTKPQYNKMKCSERDVALLKLRKEFEHEFGTTELDYYIEPLKTKWKNTEVNELKSRYDSKSFRELIYENFEVFIKDYTPSLLEKLESLLKSACDHSLDIYPVNINGQFRVGRKEIEDKKESNGTPMFLINFQKNDIKVRIQGSQISITELSDRFLEEIAEWSKGFPISRSSYWPNKYNIKKEFKSQAAKGVSMEQSLNQILYGPPGTGKTYNTINKALEIVDPDFLAQHNKDRTKIKARFDELKKSNRIGFVTFHQSFSYEDFVEGLKANSNEAHQISYEIEDGIFKQMCVAGNAHNIAPQNQQHLDVVGRKVWKMSLGDTLSDDAYIYQQCIENNYVLLGYGGNIDFSSSKDRKSIIDTYYTNKVDIENANNDYRVTSVHHFKNIMTVGDLIIVSDGNHKFRAIAEVIGDYEYDPSVIDDESYSQKRAVLWHRIYEPSLPVEELFTKNLSQQAIYRLRPPTLLMDHLQAFLDIDVSTEQLKSGMFINSYKVCSITKELINFLRPNGVSLPIARSMVNELVKMFNSEEITIDDIKNKKVFDKTTSLLDKNFINSNNNLFAPLIDYICKHGMQIDSARENEKRVLIIDEINRGNISNIFGELITLIEPSKRAGGSESLSVKLPYSKKPLSVPSNLHIIGTMNTADKSLAQVDIALRRRFEFVEMMPNHELLNDVEVDGVEIAKLLETINQRIELLYDREHTIGHSFFLPLKDDRTIKRLAKIFELEILPLLEEYFFEDWERVGQVLGDHLKTDASLKFIEEKFTDTSIIAKLMGPEWQQEGITPYKRNIEALNKPEAYIGVYEAL